MIEESLRRDLKLDVLDERWSGATMSEAKASERRAFLVTGDQHLLGLRDSLPILTAAKFAKKLGEPG